MNRLPQELAVEILSRLPLLALLRSKFVCRAWHILIQHRVLLDKHFERMVDNDPTFILQIINRSINNNLYFGDFSTDPNDESATMITKKLAIPPPLHAFHLMSSCNGLLCLRAIQPSVGHCIYIYNPFTMNYIELPKHSPHAGVLGFGFDPKTKNYKVLDISYKRKPSDLPLLGFKFQSASSSSIKPEILVLTVGSLTWRNLGSCPFDFKWTKPQVLVKDKLHWIAFPHSNKAINLIMSFDLADEQFKEVPRPDSFSPDKPFQELLVLRGCLSGVCFDDDDEELKIWVMKEYDVKESWVKEYSIGVYVPRAMNNNSRFYLPKNFMRVLCQLRCGGIVLECKSKELVVHDPRRGTFRDLQVTFGGISRYFREVVHVASLNWINQSFDDP